MKNRYKFKTEKEAREAHKQWCFDMAKIGRVCMYEYYYCFFDLA